MKEKAKEQLHEERLHTEGRAEKAGMNQGDLESLLEQMFKPTAMRKKQSQPNFRRSRLDIVDTGVGGGLTST